MRAGAWNTEHLYALHCIFSAATKPQCLFILDLGFGVSHDCVICAAGKMGTMQSCTSMPWPCPQITRLVVHDDVVLRVLCGHALHHPERLRHRRHGGRVQRARLRLVVRTATRACEQSRYATYLMAFLPQRHLWRKSKGLCAHNTTPQAQDKALVLVNKNTAQVSTSTHMAITQKHTAALLSAGACPRGSAGQPSPAPRAPPPPLLSGRPSPPPAAPCVPLTHGLGRKCSGKLQPYQGNCCKHDQDIAVQQVVRHCSAWYLNVKSQSYMM